MATKLDTLYYDVEMRTSAESVQRAATEVKKVTDALGTQVPLAATQAGNAIRQQLPNAIKAASQDVTPRIERVIRQFEQMATAVDTTSRKAVDGFRNQGDAIASYLVKLGASDQQLGRVGAAIDGVDQRATGLGASFQNMSGRTRSATVSVAAGIEQMAATGGDSITRLQGGVNSLALAFGSEGALVAAIAYAAFAIVRLMTQAQRETEATEAKLRDLIRTQAEQQRGALAAASIEKDQIDKQITDKQAQLARLRALAAGPNKEGTADVAAQQAKKAAIELNQLYALQAAAIENLRQKETERARAANDGQVQEAANLGRLIALGKATTSQRIEAAAIQKKATADLLAGNATIDKTTSSEKERTKALADQARAVAILEALKPDPKPEQDALKEAKRLYDLKIEALNKAVDASSVAAKKEQENQAAIQRAEQESLTKLAAIAGDTIAILDVQIAEATSTFRGLGATDAEIRKIVAPLQAARDAAEQLHGATERIDVPPRVQKELTTFTKGIDEGAKAVHGMGAAFSEVGQAVVSLLGLMGALDEKTQAIARGATSIGQGFANFAAGNKLQGAAQIAGGAADLLAGILTGNQQRAQEHHEALERLESIKKNTGDLVGLSLSGRDNTSIQAALQKVLSLKSVGPTFFGSGMLSRETGIPFSELQTIAKGLGVTLDGSRQSFIEFANALKSADFKAFADSFAGSLEELNTEFGLFPDRFKTSADRFAAIIALLNDEKKGAPALFAGLQGLDTSTAAGAAAAQQAIADLFDKLKEGKLTAADLNGLSIEQFLQALKDLKASLDSPAIKTAAETFTDAMDVLGVTFEFSSADAAERLKQITAKFNALFPELAAAIDFSSAEAFDASLQKIIEGFAADGELSDSEKATIAILRTLRDAFKAAVPAAQQFVDALSVLTDQFDIFGTGAVDRFTALGQALGESFPDIKDLLAGIDPTSAAGQAELQKRAQALFTQLAEGGITEDEQKIVDAIKRVLSASKDIATEQAAAADADTRKAEEKARADAERRAKILHDAEDVIAATDVTDPLEQLRIRMAALATAVPGLTAVFGQFDLATEAGRQALDAYIADLFTHPEQLAALAAQFGIPVDELTQLLLGLEGGFDSLATHVATLAEQIQGALSTVSFELDLKGITDPLERARATIEALAALSPEIADAIKGFDLGSKAGRDQAIAALVQLALSSTDDTLRTAIKGLVDQLRAVPDVAPTPKSALGLPESAQSQIDKALQSISVSQLAYNPQFAHLLDLETMQVALLGSILATLGGGGGISPPTMPVGYGAPAVAPTQGIPAAAGGTTVVVYASVNYMGPVSGDPEVIGDATHAGMAKAIDETLGRNLTFKRALQGRSELS